jgi:hypothetical protein
MSFPGDRIKADAERSRTHAAAATPLTPSVAAAPTEPVAIGRTRNPQTIRTVDLSPVQHRALDIWQREAADRFGLARVSANTCSNSVYNKEVHPRRALAGDDLILNWESPANTSLPSPVVTGLRSGCSNP